MMDQLKAYLDVMLAERFWSWTVLALVYLVVGLIIRGWFVDPLFAKVKDLKKEYAQEVRRLYLQSSALGWIFFAGSMILCVVLFHLVKQLPLTKMQLLAVIIAAIAYAWSVAAHLKAFALALAQVLRRVVEEKEVQASLYK